MKMRFLAVACLAIVPLVSVVWSQTPATGSITAAPASACRASHDGSDGTRGANQYCVTCHNEKLKKTGFRAAQVLTLDTIDTANVEQNAETWEKVVHKTRAGMMPPSGLPRPDPAKFEAMISYLETELDKHAVANIPPPGLHRLNRTEYKNAIRDLLDVDIDPAKYLPTDDSSRGFDNVAAALSISPALLEGYTAAAGKISRIALGEVSAPAYDLSRPLRYVAGLPY